MSQRIQNIVSVLLNVSLYHSSLLYKCFEFRLYFAVGFILQSGADDQNKGSSGYPNKSTKMFDDELKLISLTGCTDETNLQWSLEQGFIVNKNETVERKKDRKKEMMTEFK